MPSLVNKETTMTYKTVNENLITPPVMNPHSPAGAYKPQPVDIPGVLHQTRQLYQPVVAQPPETPAK
jgi:hypothetical protein